MRSSAFLLGFICLLSSPLIVEGAAPKKKNTVQTRAFQRLSDNEIAAQESRLIALVNEERRRYKLKPLVAWTSLTYYARQHSGNMAAGKVDFGHAGFEGRANAVQKKASCHSIGENVAYSHHYDDPLAKAVEMWMNSPHHKENILGDYSETGMGICYDAEGRCYATQLFSKRR